jgi:hypothetical protein
MMSASRSGCRRAAGVRSRLQLCVCLALCAQHCWLAALYACRQYLSHLFGKRRGVGLLGEGLTGACGRRACRHQPAFRPDKITV